MNISWTVLFKKINIWAYYFYRNLKNSKEFNLNVFVKRFSVVIPFIGRSLIAASSRFFSVQLILLGDDDSKKLPRVFFCFKWVLIILCERKHYDTLRQLFKAVLWSSYRFLLKTLNKQRNSEPNLVLMIIRQLKYSLLKLRFIFV